MSEAKLLKHRYVSDLKWPVHWKWKCCIIIGQEEKISIVCQNFQNPLILQRTEREMPPVIFNAAACAHLEEFWSAVL